MLHSGAGSRARRVACYFKLPRISLPRTPLNKPVVETSARRETLNPIRLPVEQQKEELAPVQLLAFALAPRPTL